jgi:hypothetical protein
MSQSIFEHHILGSLREAEVLEARQKVREFLSNHGLGCTDDNADLPDRLVEKQTNTGERSPIDNWVTTNLAKAYTNDFDNIRSLQINRINHIIQTLNDELNQFQKDLPIKAMEELQNFQKLIDKEIKKMFDENIGVSFIAKFLGELLESARQSRDYALQEMKNLLGHEKRLSDIMNNNTREMANLLERGMFDFLRRDAQRAQLKETYKAIRQHFINRISIMKMKSAVSFYDGVYDEKQRLFQGGEGALSRLSKMSNDISLIQAFVANQIKTFQEAYEENKQIKGSPFEILIYDNDKFSTVIEIYDGVYNDALRGQLFREILEKTGGSIWHLRDYIDDESSKKELRNIFIQTCIKPFQESINSKTVAQRIREAKKSLINPIDYGPKIQSAYFISDYFCRLDDSATRFAGLRDSEQSVACIIAYKDDNDTAYNELVRLLQQVVGKAGKSVQPSHTSDRHSILIYREFCGFQAYTLSRISAYHGSYVSEATRENTPPLQMLTKEQLEHISVPTHEKLSKFRAMVIEAIALGVIIADEESYYLLTPEEWKKRKLALEAQARGESVSIEDRTAGNNRKLGINLEQAISRMKEMLPEDARLSTSEVHWMDLVQQQIELRKNMFNKDTLCDLFEALFFEGYPGTKDEQINLENGIRPSIVLIVKRDFALKEEHIFRPKLKHQELLRSIYLPDD